MASQDVDEIGGNSRLTLFRNFVLLQHDFNHFSKLLGGNASTLGVYLVILGLYTGPPRVTDMCLASPNEEEIG